MWNRLLRQCRHFIKIFFYKMDPMLSKRVCLRYCNAEMALKSHYPKITVRIVYILLIFSTLNRHQPCKVEKQTRINLESVLFKSSQCIGVIYTNVPACYTVSDKHLIKLPRLTYTKQFSRGTWPNSERTL